MPENSIPKQDIDIKTIDKWSFPVRKYSINKQDIVTETIYNYKLKRSKINIKVQQIKIEPKKHKEILLRIFHLNKKVNYAFKNFKKNEYLKKVVGPLISEISGLRRLLNKYNNKKQYHFSLKKYEVTYKQEDYYNYYEASSSETITHFLSLFKGYIRRRRDGDKSLPNKMIQLKSNKNLMYNKYYYMSNKAGVFMDLQRQKKVFSVFNKKIPTTKNRYIGIEIEFCSKVDKITLGEELLKAGVIKNCMWIEDRSLRPKSGENGHELAILAKEIEIKTILKKVCKVLQKINAETENRRCGLHVHIDARFRDKETIFNNLVSCQKILTLMNSKSRRNNEFCKRVKSRKFPKSFKGSRYERYYTINAASYYRHRTIEVRLHDATIDYDSIINWVILLIKIANKKDCVKRAIPTINKMTKTFNLSSKTEKYIRDKVNYWKINDNSIDNGLTIS